MKETWYKIEGYDNYLVSNKKRVKSLCNGGRILKPYKHKEDSVGFVHLYKKGSSKCFAINSLLDINKKSKIKNEFDELIIKVNQMFGVDASNYDRKRGVNEIRKILFVLGKDMGLSLSYIGRQLGRQHQVVFNAVNNHKSNMKYDPFYKSIYTQITIGEDVLLKEEFNTNVLTLPNWVSDSQISEFKETRLKPYIKMLETRRKQKHFNEVPGAKIKR